MVKNTLWMILASLLLVSCGWKADGPKRIENLYPSNTDTGCEGECVDTVFPADSLDAPVDTDFTVPEVTSDVHENDLWGYYVMKMELPGTMELFEGFDPYDLMVTNWFVVFWSDDGLELEYCHQEAFLDADGLGATQMLEEAEAAIGEFPYELETADGVGIPQQRFVWTWGLQNMDDPEKDPLPTDGDAPEVWDQDNDGNPGITIQVFQPDGYRYMVRRGIWDIEPPTILDGGQRLEGRLQFQIHESAVGFDGPNSLETMIPIDPSPEGGAYTFLRTNELYTCQQLMAEEEGLFQ